MNTPALINAPASFPKKKKKKKTDNLHVFLFASLGKVALWNEIYSLSRRLLL